MGVGDGKRGRFDITPDMRKQYAEQLGLDERPPGPPKTEGLGMTPADQGLRRENVVVGLGDERLILAGQCACAFRVALCHFKPRWLRVWGATAKHFLLHDVKVIMRMSAFMGGTVPADAFAPYDRLEELEVLGEQDIGRKVLDLELDLPIVSAGSQVIIEFENVDPQGGAHRFAAAVFGPLVRVPSYNFFGDPR